MYEIIVVDDEPTGLNHVCMILQKKCPQYSIMATAENGLQALEIMQKKVPDVLITDIKMPVMGGIQLVTEVKKQYPEVMSVIVSGYSEFEYAKDALRSGVCDYLLKPLVPADLKNLMERLEVTLKKRYYDRRNIILRNLCNGVSLEEKDLIGKYFPSGKYYAAIFRKNGLPGRFTRKNGLEIFSMEEERIFIYGRDTQESLYFMPGELLFKKSFKEVAERIFYKEQGQNCFITEVVYPHSFALEDMPDVAQWLYRKLDESIIIGKNQFIFETNKIVRAEKGMEERGIIEKIEGFVHLQDSARLLREMKRLFELWTKCNSTQLQVEARIQHIFRIIEREYLSDESFANIEFGIDDIFCNASNMKELEDSVLELVKVYMPNMRDENADDKEQIFYVILEYLKANIKRNVSLGTVCREFGVSQTSLSRMFRTYEHTTFTNYLTQIRIEKAMRMMKADKNCYIKDIAECCGYNDQFYFSRIFRSVVGMCPREYIEKV